MKPEDITKIIYAAIDELNIRLPLEKKVTKKPNTVLLGEKGTIDSLGLVNLITIIEQRIEDELGRTITIADDKALSAVESPFATVDSLSNYVSRLLTEDADG